jgi:hypothetical protein
MKRPKKAWDSSAFSVCFSAMLSNQYTISGWMEPGLFWIHFTMEKEATHLLTRTPQIWYGSKRHASMDRRRELRFSAIFSLYCLHNVHSAQLRPLFRPDSLLNRQRPPFDLRKAPAIDAPSSDCVIYLLCKHLGSSVSHIFSV